MLGLITASVVAGFSFSAPLEAGSTAGFEWRDTGSVFEVAFVARSLDRALCRIKLDGTDFRRVSLGEVRLHLRERSIIPLRGGLLCHVESADGSGSRLMFLGSDAAVTFVTRRAFRNLHALRVSPDGLRIGFATFEGPTQNACYTAELGRADRPRLRSLQSARYLPAWSPDGVGAAFRDGGLWLANLDGTGERLLVPRPLDAYLTLPSWSPDGEWLLFGVMRDPFGTPVLPSPPVSLDLYVLRRGHEELRQVTQSRYVRKRLYDGNSPPVWSADGRYIAYTSRVQGCDQLFAYSLNEETERQLTKAESDCFNPQFLPDGRITFVTGAPSGRDLAVISRDGTGFKTFGLAHLDVYWPTAVPATPTPNEATPPAP